MWWVFNVTPWPLETLECRHTYCIRGCVSPRVGLEGVKNFAPPPPYQDSFPGQPSRSEPP